MSEGRDERSESYYGKASAKEHFDNSNRVNSSLPSQETSLIRDQVGGDVVHAGIVYKAGGGMIFGKDQPRPPYEPEFTKSKLQKDQKFLLKSTLEKYQKNFDLVVGKGIPKHKLYCSKESKVCRNEVSKTLLEKPTNTEKIIHSLKSDNRQVVFIGSAKTGKTYLTFKAALSLMKSNFFHYVFYCDLKFLKENMKSRKISLHEFFNNLSTTDALKEYIKFLKQIQQNKKILIILDELSCFKIERSSSNFNQFGNEGTIEEHLWNIIFGKYFQNAKKIVLTRPFNLQWSLTWYQSEYIHVIGVNHDSQKKILKHFDFTKIENLISSDFWSFFLSPFFLDLFVDYCKIAGVNNITNTGTLVHVFFGYFDLVQNDGLGKLELKELAEFAYSQFEINKLCFKTKILKDNCIDHKYLELFFDDLPSSDPGLKYSSHSSAHFLHILVQEFLTAIHIMFFLDKSQLLGVFKKSINPSMFVKYQMVCTFVCGLCNESLKNSLSIRFGKDCTDFIERCKTLESKFESILKNTLKTKNEMIIEGFYGFLNEMQNKKLRNKCLKLIE